MQGCALCGSSNSELPAKEEERRNRRRIAANEEDWQEKVCKCARGIEFVDLFVVSCFELAFMDVEVRW